MDDINYTDRNIKKLRFKIIEMYIWIFLALLTVLPLIYWSIRNKGIGTDFFMDFYYQFLFAIFILLIPILFNLIFGKFPIEYLRSKRENKEYRIEGKTNIININNINESSTKNYLEVCIKESRDISERIFTRSGVYLFIGCIIAFTGVAIFYSPIFENSKSTDLTQRLLDYLPRFGSLFFIEFIAFFFLKQYRIMLEEYRYYEGIKRCRQDEFNLIETVEKYKENQEILKIIIEKLNQKSSVRMSNNETTEILETQKIMNQDLDIFSKLTGLIKEIKTK